MLRSLDIRDILIIERLTLGFQPGLNVLTGETGAGKSILLDALGFVLGWRGRAELVRIGAERGEVEAVFDLCPGHPAHAVLADAGLPEAEDGTLILRRVNTGEGRKTAWVNDRRVSGEVLRSLSDVLVELHGQHDDRGLLNPRGHRAILDAFAGLTPQRDRVAEAWSHLRAAQKALEAAKTALEAARTEEDYLRHAVAELNDLAPQPGEDAALDAARRHMQSAGRIAETVQKAHGALGHDGGAESVLGDALRWLEDAATEGGPAGEALEAPIAALLRALNEIGEASSGVERCMDTLAVDPGALDQTEERLFAIRAMARKHDTAPDDLAALADAHSARLAALDAEEDDLARLRSANAEAQSAYAQAAAALSSARHKAAAKLDRAVTAELAPLKMDRALFATQLNPEPPGPEGTDAVEFTVATNPGAPGGPLGRIASGGELSRFLLALKVCLASSQTGLTLIFDEIDRGVGGATADAVGRRLAALAEQGQILTVTHSPQVAALGAHHWRVEKRVTGETTTSHVTPLDPENRLNEIARMLAGDRITDEARAAARALLGG